MTRNTMEIYREMDPSIRRRYNLIERDAESYVFRLRRVPLFLNVGTNLEGGMMALAYLMAPLLDDTSPEEVIESMRTLTERRDILRSRGYQDREHFRHYDEGVEISYMDFLRSEQDFARFFRDFAL